MVQIIPFYDRLFLPETRSVVSCKEYKTYYSRLPGENDMVIFVFLKRKVQRLEITADLIYPIGIRGKLYKVDGEYLVIDLKERIGLKDLKAKDGRIFFTIEPVNYRSDRRRNVFTDCRHFDALRLREEIKPDPYEEMGLKYTGTFEGMLSVLSSRLHITAEEKYMLVAEDDYDLRYEMIRYLLDGLVMENFSLHFDPFEEESVDLLELLQDPEIRQRGIEFVEHFNKLRQRKHRRRNIVRDYLE